MEHCLHHEAVSKRIADTEARGAVHDSQIKAHEGEITELFRKCSEQDKTNNEMNRSVDRINATVTSGFSMQEKILTELQQDFSEFCREAKKARNDASERFAELDKFKWFRTTMNKIKDRLPWWAAMGIIVVIYLLAFGHYSIFKFFGPKGM